MNFDAGVEAQLGVAGVEGYAAWCRVVPSRPLRVRGVPHHCRDRAARVDGVKADDPGVHAGHIAGVEAGGSGIQHSAIAQHQRPVLQQRPLRDVPRRDNTSPDVALRICVALRQLSAVLDRLVSRLCPIGKQGVVFHHHLCPVRQRGVVVQQHGEDNARSVIARRTGICSFNKVHRFNQPPCADASQQQRQRQDGHALSHAGGKQSTRGGGMHSARRCAAATHHLGRSISAQSKTPEMEPAERTQHTGGATMCGSVIPNNGGVVLGCVPTPERLGGFGARCPAVAPAPPGG